MSKLPIFGRWRQFFEFLPMWFGVAVIVFMMLLQLIRRVKDFWDR